MWTNKGIKIISVITSQQNQSVNAKDIFEKRPIHLQYNCEKITMKIAVERYRIHQRRDLEKNTP
jgi:hypothetical protein